jgi:hypothetical protein
MRLGSFVKSPVERKRYTIVYSDWLDTGETVTARVFSVSPTSISSPFVVDASSIASDGLSVVYFVSGGVDKTNYTVDVRVTTSGGQVKEDTIYYAVRDA